MERSLFLIIRTATDAEAPDGAPLRAAVSEDGLPGCAGRTPESRGRIALCAEKNRSMHPIVISGARI